MPDWSYGTILRPLLFRLQPERARDLTLASIGALAGLPGGSRVIQLLGHMKPPEEIALDAFGRRIPSPVGLGAGLDVEALATAAFSEFGLGFIEAGPVLEGGCSPGAVTRDAAAGALRYAEPLAALDAATLAARLAARPARGVPVLVRLASRPGAGAEDLAEERERSIATLADVAAGFVAETDEVVARTWTLEQFERHVRRLLAAARSSDRAVLVAIRPDADRELAGRVALGAVACGVGGVMVAGGRRAEAARLVGAPTRDEARALVRHLRQVLGPRVLIVGSGGISEPIDALALLNAGANAITLHSGLVYGGPGLPKRINEAIAYARDSPLPASQSSVGAWGWLLSLGAGLALAGTIAGVVAATTVMLPYEEDFLGISRAAVGAIDPRLLAFMSHDRITLAGGMISVGILYASLAFFGVRHGARWALHAITASAALGFASFLLFLGYRFFDPAHAVVTALLLPFFLIGIRRALPAAEPARPNLRSDQRWRVGLWGQLAFVSLGVGLSLGGLIICLLGITVVFVPSDLEFVRLSVARIDAVSSRLVPLIAHDRAGLGGLLVAEGVGVLLSSLWGFREGARWLWWTLLAAGVVGFGAALGVHFTIGYLDLPHLGPAYIGVGLFITGLALSFPYLCAPSGRAAQSPVGSAARVAG